MRLYGLTHALHAAVTGALMADRLGWAADRRQILVKAALTMNLAIVDLQGHLATHGGRLTETQRTQIRAHPEQACAALRAAGVDDEEWLRAVAEHHEQADGSGYPAGTREPSELAAALRLVDVFMAKISARVDRPALPVREAARRMFQESGGSPMAAAIVKEFGLFPPGDFVQLASGEMAVVIRRGEDARTPLVASITDRSGMPMVNTIQRDTRLPAHAITGPAADLKLAVRVPPERLYGLT
jgi:HD-GYP domain-containing protein (c-di-GMP phosphodiesterase class II)